MKSKRNKSHKAWSVLMFGKYEGKTLPQVVFLDPDWFFWAYKDGVFRNKKRLETEADEINDKARSIRIPRRDHENYVVDYIFDLDHKKCLGIEIVPASQPEHMGSSPTSRSDRIDLSIVRINTSYDKQGGKRLITCIKFYFFKDSSYKMTKKRCEDFFNNDDNFIL